MRDSHRDHPHITTLRSSSELRWSGLLAELCSYRCAEGSGSVAPHAKIAIVLAGSDTGFASYKLGRMRSLARTIPGLIWMKPSGGKYDSFHIASPKVQVLDLYLPSTVFTHLSNDYNLSKMPDCSIRYGGGLQDEVINQIGLMLLSEMMNPTTASRMLAETASLLLAARLMHGYLDVGLDRLPIEARHRLDNRRLHRVLDYIEEHLFHDIAVSDLANVACLSIYHFTRSFSTAMGMPPHRYVSQRRLDRAKTMIAAGNASIAQAAFMCRFSSQASFGRAFRRATSMTPSEYRRAFAA